ncbi:MAG: CBS domain-containing protein [Burkholderiaceae bacterium]|jgi:CBS domain-containing protein
MQVRDILKYKEPMLFKTSPEDLLSDAVVTMADENIGSLVVLSQGQLAGMLTFREILVVLAKRQREHRTGPTPTMSEITVAEVMNPKPTCSHPDMTVDELRTVMNACGERYLPVVEADKSVLGVVSFHDVARAVLEAQKFENQMLKAYIRDWPDDGSGQGQ